VSVTTRWFGASPAEVEQEILEEQEEVLKTVSGLRQMTSEAFEGEGTVRLEFEIAAEQRGKIGARELVQHSSGDRGRKNERPLRKLGAIVRR